MIRKIPRIFFYLSTLALIAVILAWTLKYIEIIAAINYTLYTFPLIVFFLNWSIMMKHRPKFRWASFILTLTGGFFWELALMQYIDFEYHWNWTFVFILSGLLLAIYGKTTRYTKFWIKISSFVSLMLLILAISLTSFAGLHSNFIMISCLSLFTISSLAAHFIKVNPRQEQP